jgi:hypothetical protein
MLQYRQDVATLGTAFTESNVVDDLPSMRAALACTVIFLSSIGCMKKLLLLALFTGCADAHPAVGESKSAIVLPTAEPDYEFPWQIGVYGTFACQGVLIAPRWVLTAAHCISTSFNGASVFYSRTDSNGTQYGGSWQTSSTSTFVNPSYDIHDFHDDIGLIRLPSNFPVGPYLVPAVLPNAGDPVNTAVTVASTIDHTGTLPPGADAVLRGAIILDGPKSFSVKSPTSSVCHGDSGSGVITYAGGREIVSGIVSNTTSSSNSTCDTPNIEFEATKVSAYLDWIKSVTQISPPSPLAISPSDIVWRYTGSTNHGQIAIWHAGTTTVPPTYPGVVADDNWQLVTSGDFDADGRDDLLWRYVGAGSSHGLISIWYDANTSRIGNPGTVPDSVQILGTGDFDFDGHSEVLFRDSSTAEVFAWPSADPSRIWHIEHRDISEWQFVGTGDFLSGVPMKGEIMWKRIGGSGPIGQLSIIFPGIILDGHSELPLTGAQLAYASSHKIQGIGDFDGNGIDDLLWRGADGTLSIWYLADLWSLRTTGPIAVDPNLMVQQIGDFDGDGRSDIYWRYTGGTNAAFTHGQLSIWYDGATGKPAGRAGVVNDDAWKITGVGVFDGNVAGRAYSLSDEAVTCTPGQSQSCGTCGTRSCGAGGTWGSCSNQGVCVPGTSVTVGCGDCGTRIDTCSNSCQWMTGSCGGQGVCSPGDSQSCCPCGSAGCGCGGEAICTSSCTWGSCEGFVCQPQVCR